MSIDFESLEGVKRALRLASTDVRNANRAANYAYSYVWDFGAVAAGAVKPVSVKITAAAAFVVSASTGVLHDGAGGSFAARPLILLELAANDGAFQQAPSRGMRWSAAGRTPTTGSSGRCSRLVRTSWRRCETVHRRRCRGRWCSSAITWASRGLS